MDNHRFELAIELASVRESGGGIGTLAEKTLHAVLKRYFEPDVLNHEVKIGPYVADIVGEDGIIEIQTAGFNKIRDKLAVFLSVARVTLVYPVPCTRWLCWADLDTGDVSKKRKSPRKGSEFDAFFELYKIKSLLTHPNLCVCLVLLDMEEYRFLNGWDKSKKRGSVRMDRIPVGLVNEIYLTCPDDYIKLIPSALPDRFTSRDYSAAAGIRLSEAQTALNVLSYVGVTQKKGKQGRLIEYERVLAENQD